MAIAGVLALCIGASKQLTITTLPKSVTVQSGDSVHLECDTTDAYEGVFQWLVYRLDHERPFDQIFSTQGDIHMPTDEYPMSKYTPSGMYGLNITGVDWRDGAEYACQFVIGSVMAQASVVVIGMGALLY